MSGGLNCIRGENLCVLVARGFRLVSLMRANADEHERLIHVIESNNFTTLLYSWPHRGESCSVASGRRGDGADCMFYNPHRYFEVLAAYERDQPDSGAGNGMHNGVIGLVNYVQVEGCDRDRDMTKKSSSVAERTSDGF